MKFRTLFVATLTLIFGFCAGATLIAFKRQAEEEPFAAFYTLSDKVKNKINELATPADAPAPKEYYSSIFTGIEGIVAEVPRETMPGAGGGLAIVGDEVLAMTFRGTLYVVAEDGSYVRSKISLPDNGMAAYRAVATNPEYADFDLRFDRLRYNEIEALENPSGRFLFLTYTEYHADQECHTLTAMRLALPEGPLAGIQISADAWEVIFRSKPCLPLRGVLAAIQGEEAGGRITFSVDDNKAYLTVGEYGWNGWDSDGLTDLSTKRLAQENDADQGKIVEIDLETLEARHFSSGHRNSQGLTMDGMGQLWAVEHGPRGGDELNLIEDGKNYGWPVVSYGSDYNGRPVPNVETPGYHTGYTKPVWAWLPSVGIGGLTAQHASFHPAWKNDLLAISLNGNTLFRIRLDGARVVFVEKVADLGRRLRDIEQLDDGRLVIWTDSHEVLFLSPVAGGFGEMFIDRYLDNLEVAEPELAATLRETIEVCSDCHSFSRQEQRIGPELARTYGSPIASVKEFGNYSDALAGASGSWTNTQLTAYLSNPSEVFPGTTMPDPAIKDAAVIEEIVKILQVLSEDKLRD